MPAALGSGVTRPEKKTGPLAEFPPTPSLPRVYCRGATIARSLPPVHIRVILPFVIEYYKLILWFILWCSRFVFHARYWSDQQSLPCMVEVDKHGYTKKLYAVAQFNEKPNFTRPNSNYISSLSWIWNGRVSRAITIKLQSHKLLEDKLYLSFILHLNVSLLYNQKKLLSTRSTFPFFASRWERCVPPKCHNSAPIRR